MATLGSAAQYLSRDALAMWLLETAPYKNQIAKIWPFMPIDGPALKVARQAAIAVADFAQPLDYNDGITEETSAPSANVTFTPGVLATRYQISYSALGRFNANQDLDAVEAALAIRRLMYAYFRMLDQNAAGPPAGSFATLTDICADTQENDMAGAAWDLDDLDASYYAVTAGEGPTAVMSNTAQVKRYLTLLRAAGLNPEFVECEYPDPIRGIVRGKQLSLYGTPWYINDLIEKRTVSAADSSNIYFMVLGANTKDPSGPFGVTGIIPKDKQSSMFMRKETNLVYDGSNDTSELNVDYIFTAGLALGQENALSILLDAKETA